MSYQGQVSTREFRRNLKEHLEARRTVLIGDRYHHVRAILVPVPRASQFVAKDVRAAKRAAKQRFTDALRSAWPER